MQTTDLTVPGAHPITVETHKRYMVIRYGAQTKEVDTYEDAMKEIGSVIMHALACADRLPLNILPKD